MHILVDNRLAVLKKGTSFEYIAENYMFTGSDGYTLTLSFPLNGCPENTAIFGHVNRKDVAAKQVLFDCEIRDRGLALYGSLAVTEINESEVKAQFLEGRSAQNFRSTFDTIYVNRLTLGAHPVVAPAAIAPADAWDPEHNAMEAVALPWINSSSGVTHNFADCVPGTDTYVWNVATTQLSWMPYLNFVIESVASALGYSCDISPLTSNPRYKYLLLCNVVPTQGADYSACLPHWTVEEFFEKLGLFLRGRFSFNHRERSISFTFNADALAKAGTVTLDKVVNAYSTSVASVNNDAVKHVDACNILYKERDFAMWRFYVCDEFLKGRAVMEFDSLDELLPQLAQYMYVAEFNIRDRLANSIFYVRDLDMHFLLRPITRYINPAWHGNNEGPNVPGSASSGSVPSFGPGIKWFYRVILTPVNAFGPRKVADSEDVEEIELEFTPANIMYADDTFGFCLYVTINNLDETVDHSADLSEDRWLTYTPDSALAQFDDSERSPYFDGVSVGYWDGKKRYFPYQPHPWVDNVTVRDDFSDYEVLDFSLRLNDSSAGADRRPMRIDPLQKCTFSFISDTLPDPTAIFHIAGKRYVCEKITANFRTEGMSQLLKGVFYPVDV